jgi:hypothetical protein
MKAVIKKGQHKSNEWYRLFFGNKIERVYKFTKNSIYNLSDEDQKDWNKLFGFTSGILPKFKVFFNTDERIKYCDFKIRLGKWYWCVFMPYHWDSARFGWRYNTVSNRIELDAYVYDNGYRKFNNKFYSTVLDNNLIMSIEKNKLFSNSYLFKIVSETGFAVWKEEIKVKNVNNIGITLPLFFGGNEVAPNKIEIIVN